MEVRDVRRLRDFAPWLLPWGGRYLCACWLGLRGALDLMWFLATALLMGWAAIDMIYDL